MKYMMMMGMCENLCVSATRIPCWVGSVRVLFGALGLWGFGREGGREGKGREEEVCLSVSHFCPFQSFPFLPTNISSYGTCPHGNIRPMSDLIYCVQSYIDT